MYIGSSGALKISLEVKMMLGSELSLGFSCSIKFTKLLALIEISSIDMSLSSLGFKILGEWEGKYW